MAILTAWTDIEEVQNMYLITKSRETTMYILFREQAKTLVFQVLIWPLTLLRNA